MLASVTGRQACTVDIILLGGREGDLMGQLTVFNAADTREAASSPEKLPLIDKQLPGEP